MPTSLRRGEPDEIEKFCTNIADAARDRRYAIQKQELRNTADEEIDSAIKELEDKRAEYETWLKRRDDFIAAAARRIDRRLFQDAARCGGGTPGRAARRTGSGIVDEARSRSRGHHYQRNGTPDRAATLTGIMAAAADEQEAPT